MKTVLKYMLLLVVVASAKAQASYSIIEKKSPFYPDETSYTTEILGLGEDFVLAHWQEYLEDHGGTSQLVENERGDLELVTSHVKFPPLRNKEVTIKTLLAPNAAETGVDLSISIKKDDGTYMSSSNEKKTEVEALKSWLLKFNQKLRTLEKEEVFDPVKVTKASNNR